MSVIFSLILALSASVIIGVFADHKADSINNDAETVAETVIQGKTDSDSLMNIVLDLQRKLARQEKRIQFLERKDRRREKAFSQLISRVKTLENSYDFIEKQDEEHISHASKANDNRPENSAEERGSVSAPGIIRRQGLYETEHVAFTAYLDHIIGHMAQGHTIRMNQILLNDGNAFNNSTGIFTVPVSGVYLFNFHYNSHYRKTIVGLFVDGNKEVDAISVPKDSTQEMMGGNTAILRLSVGQSVWLEDIIVDDGEIFSSTAYRYGTFSGVLLY